jgi:4-hydroxyphenylacetate 3-monooxygenase
MRLDDVFVPWEQVFAYRDTAFCSRFVFRNLNWVLHYHLARLLAWAEFSLGLALATTQLQGTRDTPEVSEQLTDLIVQTETLRTALRAAAADAQLSPTGAAVPDMMHMTIGMTFALRGRWGIAKRLCGHTAARGRTVGRDV